MRYQGMKSFVKRIIHRSDTKPDLEKGQSLTELAVSLVVLFILLAGVIDLGRMFFFYLSMRDSAQEGVAYGSAFPTHCNQINDRVRSTLVDPHTVDVDILVDGIVCTDASKYTNACTGKEITITVADPDFPITMPFLGTVLGRQSINLQTRVKGTILRPACSLAP